MHNILETINGVVWGPPLIILIVCVGIYISVSTKFVQIRLLPKALKAFVGQFKSKSVTNGTSSYRALCTALAATVGTGNLAGVAGAIAIGGPGAIFWMWVCALLGMATKFAEATLAVRFREIYKNGYIGGPMYMICNGLGRKWKILAYMYCFFGVVASFGVGNAAQINTVLCSAEKIVVVYGGEFGPLARLLVGVVLAALVVVLFSGGAKRIGKMTELIVPFAAVFYILMGVAVLVLRFEVIPFALKSIIIGAFSPEAITGGVVGSIFVTLRVGTSRGVFTNEAGMGTASIAHATGEVMDPCEQGLMGIVEVFLDTVVICTITALVILCSGVAIPYGTDTGVSLTTDAFSYVLGDWICILLTVALCAFAIATVLGWGFYGARCAQFLFGDGAWSRVVILQGVVVILGACLHTDTVWLVSDILNGLMAVPNLIALFLLTPELQKLLGLKSVRNNI